MIQAHFEHQDSHKKKKSICTGLTSKNLIGKTATNTKKCIQFTDSMDISVKKLKQPKNEILEKFRNELEYMSPADQSNLFEDLVRSNQRQSVMNQGNVINQKK